MSTTSDVDFSRTTRPRRRRGAAFVTTALVGLGTVATMFAAGGTANADTPCGVSAYSDGVTVDTQTYAPDFKITVAPTSNARWAQVTGRGHEATVQIWHDVQSCVPGLYHGLADSVYQQIECHVIYGRVDFKTGPTFDFESWHFPLADPNPGTYIETGCLNSLNNEYAGQGLNLPGALDLPGTGAIA